MAVSLQNARLDDHPAVRVWGQLQPGLEPRAVEQCTKPGVRKPAVWRLELGHSGLTAVYAKRGPTGSLAVEHDIHARLLPRLPFAAARFLGFHAEADFDWIFIEDVGDRWIQPRRRAETRIVGEWMGRFHVAATALAAQHQLPAVGAERYLAHLRVGRERLREYRGNPALTAQDVQLFDELATILEGVEAQWEAIESAASGIPPTLVHGDWQTKNLRLRDGGHGPELIPIDWEMAGWGSPVVDLADAPRPRIRDQVDLAAYHAAIHAHWPRLSREDLERVRACGHLWRRLAAIEWQLAIFRYPHASWLMRPLSTMELYRTQVLDSLQSLEPWLD
jgi:aminoglycoside phosphotransferase (APT) family kinase protein